MHSDDYATLARTPQAAEAPAPPPLTDAERWQQLTNAVRDRLNRWRSGILLFPPARQGHREGVQRCIDELESVLKAHGRQHPYADRAPRG